MAIRGMIFDNQIPTAQAFRTGFFNSLNDGILQGCEISWVSPYVIEIGSGYIVVAGGIFKIDGTETITLDTSVYDHKYIRIYAEFDPSKDATEDEFEQISFGVQMSTNNATPPSFDPLVKSNDVNASIPSGKYQAEIWVLNVENTNTNPYIIRNAISKVQYVDGSTVNVTIPSGGHYATISSPNDLPVNAQLVGVEVITWSNSNGPWNIIPYANRDSGNKHYVWLMASAGTTVSGLKLRYYYI